MAEQRPVFFICGYPDYLFTDGKLLDMASYLQHMLPACKIHVVTDESEVEKGARDHQLQAWRLPLESAGVSLEQRIAAIGEIRASMGDESVPGTELPWWKVLAMDDYVGSLMNYGVRPPFQFSIGGAVCLIPITGIDNNSRQAAALSMWVMEQSRANNVVTVGIEVSPLGNKQTLSHLDFDYWLIRTDESRRFLIDHQVAPASRIQRLRQEDAYLTWPGNDDYTAAYLSRGEELRAKLHVARDRTVVVLPHSVAHFYEIRKMLEVLAAQQWPRLSLVIRVDPQLIRRGSSEEEMVRETYRAVLGQFEHVEIVTDIGDGLLMQLADLVLAPNASAFTLRAQHFSKPIIIFQVGAEPRVDGTLRWVPTVKQCELAMTVFSQTEIPRSLPLVLQHILNFHTAEKN